MKRIREKDLLPRGMKFNKNKDILLRRSGAEHVLYAIVFVLFAVYALSLLYPLIWMFIASLKTHAEFSYHRMNGMAFHLPESPQFINYINAIKSMGYKNITFPLMLFNSLWYTLISAVTGVFMSAITGYCLSKFRFKLRGIIYGIAIFSMTVPIMGNMVAAFKLYTAIGLYDSPLYILVSSLYAFGFNFLVMYGFFSNVSWNYAEAVFVDGGGQFTAFFKIMLPQARAPMITLIVMAFISAWNDYQTPILYMPSYLTVSAGLYYIEKDMTRRSMPEYFSALMISMLPLLVLFAACSDMIMQNLTMGGLKG